MKIYEYKIIKTNLSGGSPELHEHIDSMNVEGKQGWRAIYNILDVERHVFLTLLEKQDTKNVY